MSCIGAVSTFLSDDMLSKPEVLGVRLVFVTCRLAVAAFHRWCFAMNGSSLFNSAKSVTVATKCRRVTLIDKGQCGRAGEPAIWTMWAGLPKMLNRLPQRSPPGFLPLKENHR